MLLQIIFALLFVVAKSIKITEESSIWKLDRPSLFKNQTLVKEISGLSEISTALNNTKNKPELLFIYHPDCGDSKKSAPEWLKMTKYVEDAKVPVTLNAINTSLK